MSYCRITAASTVHVPDHKNLQELWREWRQTFAHLYIGRVIVGKPLTEAQRRRLPSGLRAKVRNPDDSAAFLETLWSLHDPRTDA